MSAQPWRSWETAYLLRGYPRHGARHLQRNKLRHRSLCSIRAKAFALGIQVGDLEGYTQAAALDALLGLARGSTKRSAQRRGVGRLLGGRRGQPTRGFYVVPNAWADAWVARTQARQEADALVDSWYTAEQMARFFAVPLHIVYKTLTESTRLSDIFADIEVRRCSRRHYGRHLFNPWQTEAILADMRKGTMLSKHQATVLLTIAEGGTLGFHPAQGDAQPRDEYRLHRPDDQAEAPGERVYSSAVRRLLREGYLHRPRHVSPAVYLLTERGQEAAERLAEARDGLV